MSKPKGCIPRSLAAALLALSTTASADPFRADFINGFKEVQGFLGSADRQELTRTFRSESEWLFAGRQLNDDSLGPELARFRTDLLREFQALCCASATALNVCLEQADTGIYGAAARVAERSGAGRDGYSLGGASAALALLIGAGGSSCGCTASSIDALGACAP